MCNEKPRVASIFPRQLLNFLTSTNESRVVAKGIYASRCFPSSPNNYYTNTNTKLGYKKAKMRIPSRKTRE